MEDLLNNINIIGIGNDTSIDLKRTSFYLTIDNSLFLFECNEDTFRYIQKHRELEEYDHWIIYISSLSEEHCNGLVRTVSLLYSKQINITIISNKKIKSYLKIMKPKMKDVVNIINLKKEDLSIMDKHTVDISSYDMQKGILFTLDRKNIFAYIDKITVNNIREFKQNKIQYLIASFSPKWYKNNITFHKAINIIEADNLNRLIILNWENKNEIKETVYYLLDILRKDNMQLDILLRLIKVVNSQSQVFGEYLLNEIEKRLNINIEDLNIKNLDIKEK